jgi:hypothetical protein
MPPTKPQSLADKEATARKDSVLLRHAYLFDSSKGKLLPKNYPKICPELLEVFEELVATAMKYKKVTGYHLPFLGELGELYAAIMFGIDRHRPRTQGSDGMLGNDFVEVKTITPDKRSDVVRLKLAGNFNKVVVVKISEDFQFAARMVERRLLQEVNDEWAELSWGAMIAGEPEQEFHRSFPMKKVIPKPKP